MSFRYRLFSVLVIIAVCLTGGVQLWSPTANAQPENWGTVVAPDRASTFGYGLVTANSLDSLSAQAMGFNWLMVFDPPSAAYSYPNVLRRINATSVDLLNLPAFQSRVLAQADHVQAVQIGNEPNLISEWKTAPSASDYSLLLCVAYYTLKDTFPAVTVVSGGLAPTGRVSGTWNGHLGHNGLQQDEREFLKEFVAADGVACADAVGYNALGFRADFDAAPDVSGGTPETNCANGLCFRSVEKAHAILQSLGLGNKPIWATEVGWLTAPLSQCLSDSRWSSRSWQIVTPTKQAQNLVGAFRYARSHWPWLTTLFVFNLDFNSAPWYDQCEQMRYYSLNGQPAYDALVAMSKNWTAVYLPLVRR